MDWLTALGSLATLGLRTKQKQLSASSASSASVNGNSRFQGVLRLAGTRAFFALLFDHGLTPLDPSLQLASTGGEWQLGDVRTTLVWNDMGWVVLDVAGELVTRRDG
jgi:hypothetical protein